MTADNIAAGAAGIGTGGAGGGDATRTGEIGAIAGTGGVGGGDATRTGEIGAIAGAGRGQLRRRGLDLRDPEREAELTRLFDTQHHQLVRLAALLGAGADAEDVVAEAFCDLYRRWNRLRDPAKAVPYLRAAVCNQVRMRHRHLAVVRRHPEPARPDASSAEQEAVLREDHREVAEALLRLPVRQRQALVLRYWLDLGEREVAEAMGISNGAVKSHTSRGLAALARSLEQRR
jgi:RNA polymerase sigma-70 factor (sigma-E family)